MQQDAAVEPAGMQPAVTVVHTPATEESGTPQLPQVVKEEPHDMEDRPDAENPSSSSRPRQKLQPVKEEPVNDEMQQGRAGISEPLVDEQNLSGADQAAQRRVEAWEAVRNFPAEGASTSDWIAWFVSQGVEEGLATSATADPNSAALGDAVESMDVEIVSETSQITILRHLAERLVSRVKRECDDG